MRYRKAVGAYTVQRHQNPASTALFKRVQPGASSQSHAVNQQRMGILREQVTKVLVLLHFVIKVVDVERMGIAADRDDRFARHTRRANAR